MFNIVLTPIIFIETHVFSALFLEACVNESLYRNLGNEPREWKKLMDKKNTMNYQLNFMFYSKWH